MKKKSILTLIFICFSLIYVQAQQNDEEMKMLFQKKGKG